MFSRIREKLNDGTIMMEKTNFCDQKEVNSATIWFSGSRGPGFRDAKNDRDPGISGSREFPMEALGTQGLIDIMR